jgi:hypothetical protein
MKHLAPCVLPRCLAAVLLVLSSLHARAHITQVFPPPRPGTVVANGYPCGYNPDPGRTTALVLRPGAMVEVRWTEWINHPGHFRISFDNDGQDSFIDPASYTDFYTNAAVLLDDIEDANGVSEHSATITLPNVQCNNCTLQVMQVLTDKAPYTSGPSSDDLHRVCADLTLDADLLFGDGFDGWHT